MLKRLLLVAVAFVWLVLATVGLFRYGWTKWTSLETARFPDSTFCGLGPSYPTFGGSCEVPSDVAYGLLLTTTVLLIWALVTIASRLRRRSHQPAHITAAH